MREEIKDTEASVFEIESAKQHMELARAVIAEAEEAAEEARRQLVAAARAYLMAVEGEELIERASTVYWEMPDVPAALIASAVFGDPKGASKLYLVVKSSITAPCGTCGEACTISSRSRLAEIKKSGKSRFRKTLQCDKCIAEEQQSHAARWAERQRQEIDRDEALHTMPYREYLATEEWLGTRNRKLKQAGFKCQLCNCSGLLNVHHRTYERRGFEEMCDLVVLCRPCHAKFHDKVV